MPRDRDPWDIGDDPTIAAPGPADLPTQRTGRAAVVRLKPGDAVGPYTLVEEVGSGGFGVVWRAEQREPIRRTVAIKVIKPGMDTDAVVGRFEAERDALSVMDHPNIARVLDGGTTDAGLPCFVMEFVPGVPITRYCTDHALGLDERLELFTQVCSAVQHAHTKGVIHRDLKPSNILVREVDSEPVAKVIDFGVAKALRGHQADATDFTIAGEPIGTPAYMAPEQAEGSERDIDTRADVYGLGVVLYELLTGRVPFDLEGAGWREVSRVIRETEPARPSARVLSTLSDHTPAGATVSGRRAWSRALARDLDWIVMRCLEKDRSRRYDAVSDIALEIRRYLGGEPVLAGPPTVAYRVRKFVARHRAPVAAAGIGLTLMVAGLMGTSYGLVQAQRERGRAQDALKAEAEQRILADRRAAELERVSAFQAAQLGAIDPPAMGQTIREALIVSTPEADRPGLEASLDRINFTNIALRSLGHDIFEPTIAAVETEFLDQPLVRARLLQSVADTLLSLGLTQDAVAPQERALALRREALGDDHPDTLLSINNAAGLMMALGRLDDARAYFEEALDGARRTLGETHPDTLNAMNNMGGLLVRQQRYDEAERYWRETLRGYRATLTASDEDLLTSIANLGSLLFRRGRFDEAGTLLTEALEGRERLLGPDHPDTLGSVANVALLLREQGRLEDAEPMHLRAVEGYRRLLGESHPATVAAINNWGGLLNQLGRHDEALLVLSQAEPAARGVWRGDNARWLGSFLVKLGEARGATGDHARAAAELQEAYDLLVRGFGPEDERIGECIVRLAQVFHAWAEGDESRRPDAEAWGERARGLD